MLSFCVILWHEIFSILQKMVVTMFIIVWHHMLFAICQHTYIRTYRQYCGATSSTNHAYNIVYPTLRHILQN